MNLPDPNQLSPDPDDFDVPTDALSGVRRRTAARRNRFRLAGAAVGALALFGGGIALVDVGNGGDGGTAAPATDSDGGTAAPATDSDGSPLDSTTAGPRFMNRLETLGDCDAAHDAITQGAARMLTSEDRWNGRGPFWGDPGVLEGGTFPTAGVPASGAQRSANGAAPGEAADSSLDAATPSPAGGGAAADGLTTSGTNTIVEGVDESDLLDTDGKVLLAVRDDEIVVVDLLADGGPAVTDRVPAADDLIGRPEVYLDGDVVWMISNLPPDQDENGNRNDLIFWDGQYRPNTTTRIDKLLLDDNRVVISQDYVLVEASLRSSRVVDGTLRFVVESAVPDLDLVTPSGPGAVDAAIETNTELIESIELSDWVPTAITGVGGERQEKDLLACDRIHVPNSEASFGVTSILTLGRDGSVDDITSTTLLASSTTIGSSADRLYLSSSRWDVPDADDPNGDDPNAEDEIEPDDFPARPEPDIVAQGREVTDLHSFALSGADPAIYTASGSVPGTVLNEFGISEHRGSLRVASTVQDGRTTNRVTTLAETDDGELEVQGVVDGLGPNEDIRGVRFFGDQGYVVTYRRTDPLYVLDLSDPTDPTLEGELKITGFSSYLHPLPNGRLLGVGREATPDGRETGESKVALFDVSDPTDPTEIATVSLGQGRALAEDEHLAFLYWEPTGLIALPGSYQDSTEYGVKLLRVTDDSLELVGDLPDHIAGGIRRTMIVDDEIWALSRWGLSHHDLETFESRGYLGLKRPDEK